MTESRMNILHVSTWDNLGGSGRSAYRIHAGLRRLGVRSRMLVGKKVTQDPSVELLHKPGFITEMNRWMGREGDFFGFQYLSYPATRRLLNHAWFRETDALQLYNTHGGYFSHTILPRISALKPVVWRLSDMWALTGHCAYSYDCDRWKTGCGSCPHLEEYPPLRWDTTSLLWKIKNRIYKRSRIVIVSPSKWLACMARQSPLLGRFPVHIIPNGLDLETFRPIPKTEARQHLGLDANRPVILFSASSITAGRKGSSILREALDRLRGNGNSKTMLLIVGEGSESWQNDLGFPVEAVGRIDND